MKIYRMIIKLAMLLVMVLALTSCMVGRDTTTEYRSDNGRHNGWNKRQRYHQATEGTIQLRIEDWR